MLMSFKFIQINFDFYAIFGDANDENNTVNMYPVFIVGWILAATMLTLKTKIRLSVINNSKMIKKQNRFE